MLNKEPDEIFWWELGQYELLPGLVIWSCVSQCLEGEPRERKLEISEKMMKRISVKQQLLCRTAMDVDLAPSNPEVGRNIIASLAQTKPWTPH